MSANPPLRKPRHADGRLMTEDEIRGLDGTVLNSQISKSFGLPICDSFNGYIAAMQYATDIAAAFTVDRPDWVILCGDSDRMLIESGRGGVDRDATDYRYGEHGVRCRIHAFNGSGGVEVVLRLLRRPTPADHARARCIAALLLAAKIGE